MTSSEFGWSPRTVLVVEDDAPVRGIMEKALREQGYRVVAVSSGAEALEVAENQPDLHLLITDIVMRGVGGREVAEKLREARPGLPVLYVSGFTHKQTGLAEAEPDTPFLEKPFAPIELIERVRSILS